MHIEVGIERLHHESYSAIKLIKKLLIKNKINKVLQISYDFECDESGYYSPLLKTNTIFINPDNCYNIKEYKDDDTSPDNMFYPSYVTDNTIFGTILHEFSHYLCFQIYKNIINDYMIEFPKTRLYLNSYSNTEIDEEIANIMTLYISNPYLLKLISEKHYKFIKRYFISPTACSKETCFKKYQKFPIHIKNELKTKWGIVYNFEKKKFEKTKIANKIKELNEV